MSIGKRLFNMARAELNSLLDRAADAEHVSENQADPDEDLYRRFSLDELSDTQLEAEIERRYKARQAAARGASARPEAPPPRTDRSTAGQAAGARGPGSARARTTPADEELRRAYAALEVPFGSAFATVRKSSRALMRKSPPDRHTGSPEKQKAATELAQKLGQAYELLEKKLRK
jgi:DnaJ-domain-containing protein 1